MNSRELVEIADKAKENAYAPFSNFRVGAALLTQDGKVYTGCNVENSTYGATICAERTAVVKAVSEEGKFKLKAIAISSDSIEHTYPCGVCRQVLFEFGNERTLVYCANKDKNYAVYTLGELLPHAFKLEKDKGNENINNKEKNNPLELAKSKQTLNKDFQL